MLASDSAVTNDIQYDDVIRITIDEAETADRLFFLEIDFRNMTSAPLNLMDLDPVPFRLIKEGVLTNALGKSVNITVEYADAHGGHIAGTQTWLVAQGAPEA